MNFETDNYPTITSEHANMVAELVKNPIEILDTLDPKRVDAIHAILGVSGEAGELLDAIKKWVIYGKRLDLENVEEELGDLEFYLEQLRQAFDLDRVSILEKNITKLRKRYPKGYSDKHAQTRLDKVEVNG